MKKTIIDAYGKINISLDVLKKREDGYHEVEMIMQQIALKDIVTIEEIDSGFIIESNAEGIPLDTTNIVYKAYKILSEKFNIKKGIRVYIEKNIPVAAGLAGGSTDAAAVLKGLNNLWELNLNEQQLMDIGVNIGADVPYCIIGGTALAKGIGEKLTKLNSFSDRNILILNPGFNVSTSYVYNNLKLDKLTDRPETQSIISHIENGETSEVAKKMKNVLETVTTKEYPILNSIKNQLINCGALGSIMSGSGPTIFGIFENEKAMNKCEEKLKKSIKTVIKTKTV